MHSVRSISIPKPVFICLLMASLFGSDLFAQENSPFSRYGMGDMVPNQNIVNRGMGGVSIGLPNYLSINLNNPANLGNISNTRSYTNAMFELGGEVDIRNLKSTTTGDKYQSVNALISYLQVAFPLSTRKMEKKQQFWGMSFGLKPVTRINYKVEKLERLPGIDSLQTLYEGSGGLNQVNISTGYRIKNFSIGVSSGYTFGTREYSTKLNFINDSVIYYKSNTEAKAQFGGLFVNTGIMYALNLRGGAILNMGGTFNWQKTMNARRDKINETITFSSVGSVITIDTVDYRAEESGSIEMPVTYGIGFSYQDKNRHWLIGADFEATNWSNYRFYGEPDAVSNQWVIRAGVEYYPAKQNAVVNNYWNFVKYRAGFYYGPDYIDINGNRPNYAASIGASFPLTNAQRMMRNGEYVMLNTAVEVGGRGSRDAASFRENIVRISFGISMNARWFQKRKYD